MKSKSRLNKIDIYLPIVRRKIIYSLNKESKSITGLEKELKINRGTLKHHLKILEEFGAIKTTKKNNLSGRPVMIELKKNALNEMVTEMEAFMKETSEQFKKIKKKKE